MNAKEPYDGTLEYVRGKVTEAVRMLDDDSRSLRASVREAALLLTWAQLTEEDFRGNADAWATYTAFREMTTTQPDETYGAAARTTVNMSASQAQAAADLLRRLAESLGPPTD